MKILTISGSRNPSGQTARACKGLSKGLETIGGDIEHIFLPTLKINHCRQCENDGWGICLKEGKCVINDDFATIIEKIKDADGVVFATPVYFFDMSESMGALINRLCRICFEYPHPEFHDKPTLGLCVAGGGGAGAIECCFRLEKMLSRCKFNIIEMIPVRRQNLNQKLPRLQITGEMIASEIIK